MGQYIFKRIASVPPMLLVISMVVFGILQLVPGDPVLIYIGEDRRANPEYVAQIRRELGLDQPLHIQYLRWLGRTLQGDLGTSTTTKRDVSISIAEALPKTLYLAVTTMVLAIAIGVPCGIISAVRRNSKLDLFITVFATFGVAMPSFWLAILLILFISVQLGWLPAFGYVDPWVNPTRSFQLILLPALTLGLHLCAAIMRQLRSSLLGVLNNDYVRTARAKGLSGRAVLFRHALRNALIPVTTIIGVQASVLIGGSVITETIFAIPGLGRLATQSIATKDYPILMGSLLVITLGVLVINLLVDISYSILDPRIRYS